MNELTRGNKRRLTLSFSHPDAPVRMSQEAGSVRPLLLALTVRARVQAFSTSLFLSRASAVAHPLDCACPSAAAASVGANLALLLSRCSSSRSRRLRSPRLTFAASLIVWVRLLVCLCEWHQSRWCMFSL